MNKQLYKVRYQFEGKGTGFITGFPSAAIAKGEVERVNKHSAIVGVVATYLGTKKP